MIYFLADRLKSIIARLKDSHFVRNVAVVGGGIAAAQAINLAFTPLITRLYGPEAFGFSAAFAAIVSIVTPLATLGYANAIVIPNCDQKALAVVRLSMMSGLAVAFFCVVLIYLLLPLLAIWTGLEHSPEVLYLIPLSLIFSSFLTVASQVAIREGLFKAKAFAYVESTLLINLGKLAGGLTAPSGILLIFISLIGQFVNFLLQMLRASKSTLMQPRNWFGFDGVRDAGKKHQDFVLYRMPQSLIRASSMGLPVIILTGLFGPASAGQYSLALVLLGAPVMLLGESVGEVFYPKITRAINSNEGSVKILIGKAVSVLTLVGIIPFGIIALYGDLIIPWFSGNEWARSGEYSQWIALWMFSTLMSRPAVAAMPALNLQSTLLAYEILITGARIAALYAGFQFGDDLTSISLFSMVNLLGYASLTILVILKTNPSGKNNVQAG